MKQIAEGPYPENVIKLGVLDHCESLVLEADGKRGEIEELFGNVRIERRTKKKTEEDIKRPEKEENSLGLLTSDFDI